MIGNLQGWASTPARDVLYWDALAREAWTYSDGQRVFVHGLLWTPGAVRYAKRHGVKLIEVR